MKNNLSPYVELANKIIEQGRSAGILHHTISDKATNGRTILLDGKNVTYFGNCSYLGLEIDPRLKAAAIDAIERYGTQFPCSRTYASLPLYDELEHLLSQVFDKPTIVAPTTTLAHMSTVPVLMRRNDAILIDQQAHSSMHNAAALAKDIGTHVEILRHNKMDFLESRIKELSEKYDRIWLMTDGVFSMFGDVPPLSTLWDFMNRYDKFYCYIDDAHGMSWAGHHGNGYTLSQLPSFHDKLMLLTSLTKGFGSCGAAIVSPNEDIRRIILNTGTTLRASGPVQPAALGSMIASAKIHLSPEINDRQDRLRHLMSYFTLTAKSLHLPLVSQSKTPIFFIGVGTPDSGAEIILRMLRSGYLLNPSSFPSVSYKHTGIRISLTTHHTEQDIRDMLTTLSAHLNEMEQQKKLSRQDIRRAFGIPLQNN
ncbi:MAG: aminotransferase class I/II-fold pyridoxal phosphate-dependent enzyme [Saprospiraceae bacterium]|nr:aminotransferase class I/II-fold pyridoxal phosphate-dependent enzyme [Saprospiraceae bacterium]